MLHQLQFMDWRIAHCDFCNFSSSQKVNIDTRDCVKCVKYLACKNVDSYVFLCPCPVSSLDPQYWCFWEPEDRQSLKTSKLFNISVWESQERFWTLYDYDICMILIGHQLSSLIMWYRSDMDDDTDVYSRQVLQQWVAWGFVVCNPHVYPVCPAACPIVHELSTRLILASWISSPCMVISPA